MNKFLLSVSIISSLFFVWGCSSTDRDVQTNLNVNFRQDIVKALGVTFVNKDSMYLGSRTQIFNDTIIGLGKSYFIQSLKDLSYKKVFDNSDVQRPTRINQLRNGCLYFGDFSHSYMVRICQDGTIKKYFVKSGQDMFYANKVYLHEDRTIIISMDAVYIFNTESEELVWKHRYSVQPELIWSTVVDGKLLFLECPKQSANHLEGLISCLDIKKLKYIWRQPIIGECAKGTGYDDIEHSHREIFLRTQTKLIVVNLLDGSIGYENKDLYYLTYDSEKKLYFGITHTGVVCLNSKFQRLWTAPNCNFQGQIKNYIVVYSLDRKHLTVIHKSNGKAWARIVVDYPKDPSTIEFMDNYLIFNGMYVYK